MIVASSAPPALEIDTGTPQYNAEVPSPRSSCLRERLQTVELHKVVSAAQTSPRSRAVLLALLASTGAPSSSSPTISAHQNASLRNRNHNLHTGRAAAVPNCGDEDHCLREVESALATSIATLTDERFEQLANTACVNDTLQAIEPFEVLLESEEAFQVYVALTEALG